MATQTYSTNNVQNEGGGVTTVYTPTTPIVPPAVPVTPVPTPPASQTAPATVITADKAVPTGTPAFPTTAPTVPTAANDKLTATLSALKAQALAIQDKVNAGATSGASTDSTAGTAGSGNSRQSVLDKLMSDIGLMNNKGADTTAANEKYGIDAKTQAVTDLTNEYNTKDLAARHAQENAFARAGNSDTGNAEVSALQRQSNSELADIAVQKAAATGDLSTAATLAKQAVDAKYEPLQAEITNLTSYYNLTQHDMTDSEQLQAQAAIAAKQKAVDAQTAQDLAGYEEKLKENDPLHAAQIAEAFASANSSNASAAKTKLETSQLANGNGTAGYDGSFGNTISLAANTGTTNQQRAAIQTSLQQYIAQKDYKSAYALIQQTTANSLQGAARNDFQNRASQLQVTSDLNKSLTDLKNAGYNTNLLTGGIDSIQNKIGVLAEDPKYAAAAVELGAALQSYRLQMTGANFSAKEASDYASVLPNKSNTFALNMTKVAGLQNFLNSSVDSYTHEVVGDGGKEIREYADGATPATQTTDAATGTKGSLNIGGQSFTIGSTIINAKGQKGTLNADGTVTLQ